MPPYLPPDPDMPDVQSPTVGTSGTATKGAPSGIAGTAFSVGKPGKTQHLGNITGRRGAGMSTATGGNPMMHSLNHYGVDPPPLLAGMSSTPGSNPTEHGGSAQIRGGSGRGGIRKPRHGGLGPVLNRDKFE